MVNMRILIRIVFLIFIANGIDCLGRVCDDCCDNCCYCFKGGIKEDEEIKKNKNNPAESLVNKDWFNAKKDNPVLKIFKKEDDNDIFTSTENEDKISIKLEGKDNPKIAYLQKKGEEDPLKLGDEKYALFEIKTGAGNIFYLYCSDVESIGNDIGIFTYMYHISISVIACDTENVMNMNSMFYYCCSLTELDLNNFNTENVMYMSYMFNMCSNLEKLDIKNFNTTNVTDMPYMFSGCSSLAELEFGDNFNTSNVTNMEGMFSKCSGLKNLKLNNFNTEKVTNMKYMFSFCSSLEKLKFGENFNTEKVTDMEYMFYKCSSFPEKIQSNLNNIKGIINYFKVGKIF